MPIKSKEVNGNVFVNWNGNYQSKNRNLKVNKKTRLKKKKNIYWYPPPFFFNPPSPPDLFHNILHIYTCILWLLWYTKTIHLPSTYRMVVFTKWPYCNAVILITGTLDIDRGQHFANSLHLRIQNSLHI